MTHNSGKERVFLASNPPESCPSGNYGGALSLWRGLQKSYKTMFCIASLHALTIPEHVSPASHHANSCKMAALYIAFGETLVVAEIMTRRSGARIAALDDPSARERCVCSPYDVCLVRGLRACQTGSYWWLLSDYTTAGDWTTRWV
jgi:hypothetical protein